MTSGNVTNDVDQPVARAARKQWRLPAGLVLLIAIPVAAGVFRLSQLAFGAKVTPENARFFTTPMPITVHIVSASLFCLFGALQFVPNLRQRRHRWHRVSGRLIAPLGAAAALSGLWMAAFYSLPTADDALLEAFRLIFGAGMVLSLILGVVAIRMRAFDLHRRWMMRGYAIGLAAGTQVFTLLAWAAFVRTPTGVSRAVLMAAGWVINLGVVEWSIRRDPETPPRAMPALSSASCSEQFEADRSAAGVASSLVAVAALTQDGRSIEREKLRS